MKPAELAAEAYSLYEKFRPAIPAGARGWGAKGGLDLRLIRKLPISTAPWTIRPFPVHATSVSGTALLHVTHIINANYHAGTVTDWLVSGCVDLAQNVYVAIKGLTFSD